MEITKAVLLDERGILGWSAIPGGRDSTEQVSGKALETAAQQAGINISQIEYVVATGVGRDFVRQAHQKMPDFMCLAAGINRLLPSTRTLLDLGARKSLAIKCRDGKTLKMGPSSKCASGTGTYLKIVSGLFNLSLEEMADLSMNSKSQLEIQTACAVFAESEIISLIHSGARPEDILKAVFKGLAERLHPLFLEIGVEPDVTITGGFARNKAVIAALENLLGFSVQVPENPVIPGALGAAIIGLSKRSMSA